jgi:hypothetical protein
MKVVHLAVVAIATFVVAASSVVAQSARDACSAAARALVRQELDWDESARSLGGDTLSWRARNGTRGICRVDERGRVFDVRVESWASGDDIEFWPPATGDLTEESDYDRRGSDYRNFESGSLGACQEACRREASCRAYTYSRREQRCWLKNRANSRQFSRDMVTGYKLEGGGSGGTGGGWSLTEERGEDRRGADYADFRAVNLRDCQDACRRDPRCRAYTYDTSRSVCFVKSSVPSAVRDSRMVTGYKP